MEAAGAAVAMQQRSRRTSMKKSYEANYVSEVLKKVAKTGLVG